MPDTFDYTQPAYLDKRVRYYDGQDVRPFDHNDEQKYLIDRQRRLGKLLYTPGVLEGLLVDVVKDGSSKSAPVVRVAPGTAIDASGCQIVLARPFDVTLNKDNRNTPLLLVISYDEVATDVVEETGGGSTRWHEQPIVEVVPALAEGQIPLARLTLNDKGVLAPIDYSARQLAGVRLPTVGKADEQPSLRADISGNLGVSTGQHERLTITSAGKVGVGLREPEATLDVNGSLHVRGATTLSDELTVTKAATLNDSLTVAGDATLNSDLTVANAATVKGNLTVGADTTEPSSMTIQEVNNGAAHYKLTVLTSQHHLQLRRAASETSGGKVLALELFQEDSSPPQVPETSFSIRFHHGNRYWHRLEVAQAGFYFRHGDLTNNNLSDISAGTVNATQFVGQGAVVKGMIVMWSGSTDAIPEGWALCDGQDGRPDLRDRFVIGAGPVHAPGTRGEPDTHVHPINPPQITVQTSAAGDHNHAPPSNWYNRSLLGGVAAAGKEYYNAIDRGSPGVQDVRTSTAGNHAHSVTVGIPGFNSTASTGENKPRWWALAFIIKL